MDQVTQQNAARVEESAAAAGSISAQAQKLAEVVSVFKIDGAAAQSATGAATAARGADRAKNVSRPAFKPKPTRPQAATSATASLTSGENFSCRLGDEGYGIEILRVQQIRG